MPWSANCGGTALASMDSVADCFNALAKSVFATLECELFYQQPGGRFPTRREAKLALFDYLVDCSRFCGPELGRDFVDVLYPSSYSRGVKYPRVECRRCLL